MQTIFGKLKVVPLMFSVLLLMMVPVALAQEPTPDFTAELKVLSETLVSFVLASLIWALTGFFKVRDPKEEPFDPVQFFTTVIVGAITGLIAFAIYEITGTSLAPTQIWQYLVAAGFVAFVESWMKVVWRRLKPYFTPPA